MINKCKAVVIWWKCICSIKWGNGFGHFLQALSKPYEEICRIFVVLQKFGVVPGVCLLQTPNIRPRKKVLQAHFERVPARNTQTLIPMAA